MSLLIVKLPQPTAAGVIFGSCRRVIVPRDGACPEPGLLGHQPCAIAAGSLLRGDPNEGSGLAYDWMRNVILGFALLEEVEAQDKVLVLNVKKPLGLADPMPWRQDGALATWNVVDRTVPALLENAERPDKIRGRLMEPAGPIDTQGD